MLRQFATDDVDPLCVLFGDPRVTRYLYWEVRDRATSQWALERSLNYPIELGAENVLPVAVTLADNGELIGDFMLRWKDDEHRQGEMGGTLLPREHGRGYATEVYGALLAIGFNTYQLHRIEGKCDARNTASIRSLEKAGLHEEARLVENEFVKGEWTDEVVMAIRRSQWTESASHP